MKGRNDRCSHRFPQGYDKHHHIDSQGYASSGGRTRWRWQPMSLYRLPRSKTLRHYGLENGRFRGCQLLCAGRQVGDRYRVHAICEQAEPTRGSRSRLSSVVDVQCSTEVQKLQMQAGKHCSRHTGSSDFIGLSTGRLATASGLARTKLH